MCWLAGNPRPQYLQPFTEGRDILGIGREREREIEKINLKTIPDVSEIELVSMSEPSTNPNNQLSNIYIDWSVEGKDREKCPKQYSAHPSTFYYLKRVVGDPDRVGGRPVGRFFSSWQINLFRRSQQLAMQATGWNTVYPTIEWCRHLQRHGSTEIFLEVVLHYMVPWISRNMGLLEVNIH